MSQFSDQEVWCALGNAIDMSKMGHIIWAEIYTGTFRNNKSKISVSTGYNSVQCFLDGQDVTLQGGELVDRLYKAAQWSAIANKKTYTDELMDNGLLTDGYLKW